MWISYIQRIAYMFEILLVRHRVDRVLGFFLQSSELGPQASGPPLSVPGARAWGVPIRTRGHTLWYSRYICTSCMAERYTWCLIMFMCVKHPILLRPWNFWKNLCFSFWIRTFYGFTLSAMRQDPLWFRYLVTHNSLITWFFYSFYHKICILTLELSLTGYTMSRLNLETNLSLYSL